MLFKIYCSFKKSCLKFIVLLKILFKKSCSFENLVQKSHLKILF
ncbi:hypothetical protein M153_1000142820 [Pseudoloma neurophilia]|uniref:Uncharacterized protein n=1 Tax=Pseudoloma neurophilia TaxID=146866 RepID=A0A0R0M1J8_9MICR|nr:hypothetical protein M153_1000142820 [Pseudoloma neurophilia]